MMNVDCYGRAMSVRVSLIIFAPGCDAFTGRSIPFFIHDFSGKKNFSEILAFV